ncbi:hypothetical protein [Saccharopolyspora spinosa]|uniref:Uncharacterized protein n=1 Tax=Saccharopolyspora spinosa TaxID=60894 RepID=A0A2N3Y7X5_SACSN|nr:hypothetical protein [Saccharopolyspora spinosa]PKW18988.1 hypothetical protein A8926_7128 [Saccharopolyspora spinosa]
MRVFGRSAGLATMSGVLLATAAGTAHAGPSSDGHSDTRGVALVQFSNNGDSLIEVDRTLNFNSGDGSAGSDNDN